jgi:hypothetical protein
MISSTLSESASAIRDGNGLDVSRNAPAAEASTRFSPLRFGRRDTRSSKRAPLSKSLASSSALCAAATFTSTVWRQVDHGSLHASTRYVHSPSVSGTITAAKMSGSTGCGSIRVCRAARSVGPRQATVAATAS